MTPRSVNDWKAILTWGEWFLWLIREHSPQQIAKAIRAAHETIDEPASVNEPGAGDFP